MHTTDQYDHIPFFGDLALRPGTAAQEERVTGDHGWLLDDVQDTENGREMDSIHFTIYSLDPHPGLRSAMVVVHSARHRAEVGHSPLS